MESFLEDAPVCEQVRKHFLSQYGSPERRKQEWLALLTAVMEDFDLLPNSSSKATLDRGFLLTFKVNFDDADGEDFVNIAPPDVAVEVLILSFMMEYFNEEMFSILWKNADVVDLPGLQIPGFPLLVFSDDAKREMWEIAGHIKSIPKEDQVSLPYSTPWSKPVITFEEIHDAHGRATEHIMQQAPSTLAYYADHDESTNEMTNKLDEWIEARRKYTSTNIVVSLPDDAFDDVRIEDVSNVDIMDVFATICRTKSAVIDTTSSAYRKKYTIWEVLKLFYLKGVIETNPLEVIVGELARHIHDNSNNKLSMFTDLNFVILCWVEGMVNMGVPRDVFKVATDSLEGIEDDVDGLIQTLKTLSSQYRVRHPHRFRLNVGNGEIDYVVRIAESYIDDVDVQKIFDNRRDINELVAISIHMEQFIEDVLWWSETQSLGHQCMNFMGRTRTIPSPEIGADGIYGELARRSVVEFLKPVLCEMQKTHGEGVALSPSAKQKNKRIMDWLQFVVEHIDEVAFKSYREKYIQEKIERMDAQFKRFGHNKRRRLNGDDASSSSSPSPPHGSSGQRPMAMASSSSTDNAPPTMASSSSTDNVYHHHHTPSTTMASSSSTDNLYNHAPSTTMASSSSTDNVYNHAPSTTMASSSSTDNAPPTMASSSSTDNVYHHAHSTTMASSSSTDFH